MMLSHLFWVDLETTALPVGNDYSGVHILEVGAILSDTSLNGLGGYHESLKFTEAAILSLKDNPQTYQIHKQSGLISDCMKSQISVSDAEQELLKWFHDSGVQPGSVAIAGSGVSFDKHVLQQHMPTLSSYFVYFLYDIGVFRRMMKVMTGGHDMILPVHGSYGESKLHRAWDDIQAHFAEAEKYSDWLHKRSAN